MSSQLFSKSNLLFGLLVILLLFLQHRLWLGDGGREELDKLKQEYQQINEKASKLFAKGIFKESDLNTLMSKSGTRYYGQIVNLEIG